MTAYILFFTVHSYRGFSPSDHFQAARSGPWPPCLQICLYPHCAEGGADFIAELLDSRGFIAEGVVNPAGNSSSVNQEPTGTVTQPT